MLKSKKSPAYQNQKLELTQRLKKLKSLLKLKNLDAFLVSSQANRTYLTGWQGDSESGFVLVTPTAEYIITDSRYSEHALRETNLFEIIETTEGIGPALNEIVEKDRLNSVGFESRDLSVFSLKRLTKFVKEAKVIPNAHLVEEIRSIKSAFEIEQLKRAAVAGDKAFKYILGFIHPGRTEEEIAWELTNAMRKFGAGSNAWDPLIVAAGANSSMAHYQPGNAKIKKGDQVLLDFGANVDGYCSDMTRMVFAGKPNEEQKKIYNAVLEAQKIGLSLVKEGRRAAIIDKKVRRFIEKQSNYCYRHGLGHGIGLEVHELPSVSIHSKQKLVAGNTITIEPGIYIPKWGGVRIEDMVVVTKDGCRVLTKAPKEINGVTI